VWQRADAKQEDREANICMEQGTFITKWSFSCSRAGLQVRSVLNKQFENRKLQRKREKYLNENASLPRNEVKSRVAEMSAWQQAH
jgi:hypothetical protein